MLTPIVSSGSERLPRSMWLPDWRNRVLVALTDGHNLALLSPVKDSSVWMPAQGPINHNLSLVEAARQVLRTEIPSVQRPHPHAPPYIDWDSAFYVGSAFNPHARGGQAKFIHGVVVRARQPITLRADPSVATATDWATSNEDLEYLLGQARQVNRDKYAIVMELAMAAHNRGWLE